MSKLPQNLIDERERTDKRDLQSLLDWLEYGRTSGFRAARQSKAQEEYWADLLRQKLKE